MGNEKLNFQPKVCGFPSLKNKSQRSTPSSLYSRVVCLALGGTRAAGGGFGGAAGVGAGGGAGAEEMGMSGLQPGSRRKRPCLLVLTVS